MLRELGPIDAGFPERLQRRGKVALREAPTVIVGNEAVVEICWFWKVEQCLKQTLGWGGRPKIFFANDQVNPRLRIIDDA